MDRSRNSAHYARARRRSYVWAIALACLLSGAIWPAAPTLFTPLAAQASTPVFADRTVFGSSADTTAALAVGDMNNDGRLDLVLANNGQQNKLYLNLGDGKFAPERALELSGIYNSLSVAVGDLNGDDTLDVVVGNYLQPTLIYLNNGQGNFVPGGFLGPRATITYAVALGDLNDDGALDIVQGNYNQQSVVYFNDGRGNFLNSRLLGTGAAATTGIALGDVDGDRRLDIVMANYGQSNVIYYNDPGHTLRASRVFGSAADQSTSVVLGDLDADEQLDIVVGNYGTSVVYKNNGQGGFDGGTPIGTSPQLTQAVALGDINGDGALDIVLGNRGSQNKVFLNNGVGDLRQTAVLFGTGSDDTSAVGLADTDGDGALDLIVGNVNQLSVVYRSDGATNATRTIELGEGGDRTTATAIGDLNGDGLPDLVLGNVGQNLVYFGDRTGRFGTAQPIGPATSATSDVALGDLDRDGTLDVVFGNNDQRSAVYFNDGAGNFASGPIQCDRTPQIRCLGVSATTSSVAVGDLNNDGVPDIVLGNNGQQSVVLLNDGAGSFATRIPFGNVSASSFALALADINADGANDLVVSNFYGQNAVYLNDGAPVPAFTAVRPFGTGSDTTFSLAVGDLNADGHLDVVVGNARQPNAIYFGNGRGEFPNSRLFGNPTDVTQAITLADVNGDRTGDIVVGTNGQSNAVYLNDGTGAALTALPFGPGNDPTWSISVADLDRDGDQDLVVGNFNYPSLVYHNNGTGSYSLVQTLSAANRTSAVAVGDVNGDGQLDIVVAKDSQQHTVYLNGGQGRFAVSKRFGDAQDRTTAISLGDINGDSTLDVVTAGNGQPTRVYLNSGAGTYGPATVVSDDRPVATALALGDLNGDGPLDIVVANADQPGAIYLNDGVGNFRRSGSFGSGVITAVALGDINGDGAPDIVQGTVGATNAVYLNDGQGTFNTRQPFGEVPTATRSLAVGDVNGDGALDVVVANQRQAHAIYLNDGRGALRTARSFGATSTATAVALGDITGDGTLDIVLADPPSRNAVYINDGRGNFDSVRDLGNDASGATSIAVGDMSGNGTLDVVVGNAYRKDTIYLNALASGDRITNTPPRITLSKPFQLPDANFVSSARILTDTVLPLKMTLFDRESDPVRVISATFSLDGGGSWRPAIATPQTQLTGLITSPQGTTYTFNWDTFASGLFGQSDNVVVRIIAYPGVRPSVGGVPGPYQRPYAAATTFPFRVRGTQVQVVEEGRPVANARVYRWPQGVGSTFQPITTAGSTVPLTTDGQGFLRGRGQLAIGDELIALHQIAVTGPLSDSYTLYHTNLQPTATGVAGFTIAAPGVQQIAVTAAHPLALFPLDVSLEWDARNDQRFMSQLRADLARTSEFLFEATNGQVALGEVRIFQDKEWWDAVNLRIYASNRIRPNAVVGGLPTQLITDPISQSPAIPGTVPIVYGPGQVRMGAVWNRFGNPSANLSEDWPRTLAHELGHYMLFLEDNYLGIDQRGQIIPIDSCPGLMSDPYGSSIKLHADRDWLPGCTQTLSNRATGRSDWATAHSFYPALVPPTTSASDPTLSGPTTLPLAVTTITSYNPSTPTAALDVPIFYLTRNGSRYQPGLSARGFLFRPDANNGGSVARLTSLGRTNLDQIVARGAQVGDRVCIYEYGADQRVAGCSTVAIGREQIALHNTPNWPPDITVTPVTSTTLTVSLSGVPADAVARGLSVQLFPSDEELAPTSATALQRAADGTVGGTVTLPAPVDEAQIYVWVNDPDLDVRRELVVSLAIGGNPGFARTGGGFARTGGGFARTGGGFARTGGGFARTGGGFARTGGAPVSSAEGDVLLVGDNLVFQVGQFLALQSTTNIPTPPAWVTVIGNAYRFTASPSTPDLRDTSLSFSYLESDVPPGEEEGIDVYFYDPQRPTPTWIRLETAHNTYYNLASVPNQGPGLYALMTSLRVPLSAPGWNLVAYPARQPQPVATALASIAGSYTTVYRYDPPDTADPWKIYDVDAPDWVNDLQTMEYGRGYWIRATQAISLYLKGGTPAIQTTSLPTPPATFYGAVPNTAPNQALTVQAWIGTTLCGQTQTAAHPFDGVLRNTFVITVRAATSNDTNACGVAGRQVRLVANDGAREVWSILSVWDNSRAIALRPSTLRLPFLANVAPGPDLAVVAIDVLPTGPRALQPAEVRVTIRNLGTQAIAEPFWVDLYLDPRSSPQVNHLWPSLSTFGSSWRVYGLQVGETRTLSTRSANDPLNPRKNYSNFARFATPGAHTLIVLVDSYAISSSIGAVSETNERNNLGGPVTVQVNAARGVQIAMQEVPRDSRPSGLR